MRRVSFTMLLALSLSIPAFADVTIKQTTGGKGMGMGGKATGTTYIKGHKMRADLTIGDRVQSTIFDIDAQKAYFFDSKKKEADVWDMGAFAAQMGQSVDVSSIKASVKPNGQTKAFGAVKADGYDMLVTVPAAMGGGNGPKMTVTLTGPVWIVKNAPGGPDYANFYKAAAEKGFIFSDPRAAKGQPGQAKAMAEMYKQFAAIGGIAYETNMQVKLGMDGGDAGPMAGILAKMGNIEIQTLVDSVETTPVADDLFAPPAGYKLNTKQ
jgi:hypothetical protein